MSCHVGQPPSHRGLRDGSGAVRHHCEEAERVPATGPADPQVDGMDGWIDEY
jgi:hypothetical protein